MGQLKIDVLEWESAKFDLQKCVDLGGDAVVADVDKELKRLRALERKQDAKDGKYFKDSFADDRDELYDDKPVDAKKFKKSRDELRKRHAYLAAKQRKQPSTASTTRREHDTPAWDWTASYRKDRPKFVRPDDPCEGDTAPLRIDDLEAEIDEIHDEEEAALRKAKEDYYNTQLALGNMRIHAPPDADDES